MKSFFSRIIYYFKIEWLLEFWRYRELFYFLVWRDVKVRYKQTVLGAAWAIIQPCYWEALEAVANRFNAFLERKGYTLKQMLADLPATRQALWEQKYSPLLQKARKAQVADE